MKLIIAGSRDRQVSDPEICRAVVDLLAGFPDLGEVTELLNGDAKGVDECAARWAEARGIPVTKFPPDWKNYGKGAGPMRNQEMCNAGDVLIAFYGGKGTVDMIRRAHKRGLKISLVGMTMPSDE
jgi:hypothetical protein